jgi:nucleoside-diphosphate-sugar epimerase
MRVLVSGANGFVGRTLCTSLVALGHDVVPAVRRQSDIAGEVIVHDAASWETALMGCDSVVHLAARAHVMKDKEQDPLQVFRSNNVDTTIELANRAVEAGVRRFVFMSTIKVNGEQTVPGYSFSSDDPVDPKDPYAISKWEAEQELLEIAKRTGLEVVIIRPPLVYGPHVKGNFATMIKWIKQGIPLPFLGVSHNRRSMIALDNLVNFTALCADFDASPNVKSQVFLVSDGEDISTAELLRRVAKAYQRKIHLFSIPMGLMQLVARWMGKTSIADRLFGSLVIDDSKARQMLGWRPPLGMDDQLQKMAQHDSRT